MRLLVKDWKLSDWCEIAAYILPALRCMEAMLFNEK